MPMDCPVCGDEGEHERRERPADDGASHETTPEAHTTLDVGEPCAVDGDEQWDRICHRATVSSSGQLIPVLEVYYHYFGEE